MIGCLSELFHLLLLGYRFSDRFYTTLMCKFDRTGQGCVNFDDFIQCCVNVQVRGVHALLVWSALLEVLGSDCSLFG